MDSIFVTMNQLLTVGLFVTAFLGLAFGQCLSRYPQYVSVDPLTSTSAISAPADVNTLLQLACLINKIENSEKNERFSSDDIITKLIDALILVATKQGASGRDLLSVDLGGTDILTLL